MYHSRHSLVLGFHGTDETRRNEIVACRHVPRKSNKPTEWLGNGFYFWENNLERAKEYATELKDHPERTRQTISKPAVLGAIIALDTCLDLLDSYYLKLLKIGYNNIVDSCKKAGGEIPQNQEVPGRKDAPLRYLDRAVIEATVDFLSSQDIQVDSVRGMFTEGAPVYEGGSFFDKSHIQIAIRNYNCIKGFFIPRQKDTGPSTTFT